METSENHERFDDSTTPVHTDFEKIIDFSVNREMIQADSELPMVMEEIQGYSDEKMVRCKNIIVSHEKSIILVLKFGRIESASVAGPMIVQRHKSDFLFLNYVFFSLYFRLHNDYSYY